MVLDPLCLLVNQEDCPYHQSCHYSGQCLEPDAVGCGLGGGVLAAGVLAAGVLAAGVLAAGVLAAGVLAAGVLAAVVGGDAGVVPAVRCCTFTVSKPAMVRCCCGTAKVAVPVDEVSVVDAAVLLEDVAEVALTAGAVAVAGNCPAALGTVGDIKLTMFVTEDIPTRLGGSLCCTPDADLAFFFL